MYENSKRNPVSSSSRSRDRMNLSNSGTHIVGPSSSSANYRQPLKSAYVVSSNGVGSVDGSVGNVSETRMGGLERNSRNGNMTGVDNGMHHSKSRNQINYTSQSGEGKDLKNNKPMITNNMNPNGSHVAHTPSYQFDNSMEYNQKQSSQLASSKYTYTSQSPLLEKPPASHLHGHFPSMQLQNSSTRILGKTPYHLQNQTIPVTTIISTGTMHVKPSMYLDQSSYEPSYSSMLNEQNSYLLQGSNNTNNNTNSNNNIILQSNPTSPSKVVKSTASNAKYQPKEMKCDSLLREQALASKTNVHEQSNSDRNESTSNNNPITRLESTRRNNTISDFANSQPEIQTNDVRDDSRPQSSQDLANNMRSTRHFVIPPTPLGSSSVYSRRAQTGNSQHIAQVIRTFSSTMSSLPDNIESLTMDTEASGENNEKRENDNLLTLPKAYEEQNQPFANSSIQEKQDLSALSSFIHYTNTVRPKMHAPKVLLGKRSVSTNIDKVGSVHTNERMHIIGVGDVDGETMQTLGHWLGKGGTLPASNTTQSAKTVPKLEKQTIYGYPSFHSQLLVVPNTVAPIGLSAPAVALAMQPSNIHNILTKARVSSNFKVRIDTKVIGVNIPYSLQVLRSGGPIAGKMQYEFTMKLGEKYGINTSLLLASTILGNAFTQTDQYYEKREARVENPVDSDKPWYETYTFGMYKKYEFKDMRKEPRNEVKSVILVEEEEVVPVKEEEEQQEKEADTPQSETQEGNVFIIEEENDTSTESLPVTNEDTDIAESEHITNTNNTQEDSERTSTADNNAVMLTDVPAEHIMTENTETNDHVDHTDVYSASGLYEEEENTPNAAPPSVPEEEVVVDDNRDIEAPKRPAPKPEEKVEPNITTEQPIDRNKDTANDPENTSMTEDNIDPVTDTNKDIVVTEDTTTISDTNNNVEEDTTTTTNDTIATEENNTMVNNTPDTTLTDDNNTTSTEENPIVPDDQNNTEQDTPSTPTTAEPNTDDKDQNNDDTIAAEDNNDDNTTDNTNDNSTTPGASRPSTSTIIDRQRQITNQRFQMLLNSNDDTNNDIERDYEVISSAMNVFNETMTSNEVVVVLEFYIIDENTNQSFKYVPADAQQLRKTYIDNAKLAARKTQQIVNTTSMGAPTVKPKHALSRLQSRRKVPFTTQSSQTIKAPMQRPILHSGKAVDSIIRVVDVDSGVISSFQKTNYLAE